jgi:hypothetical protein
LGVKSTFDSLSELDGLASALKNLSVAGCKVVYIDGSFVTNKEIPGDYDLCWSIDSVVPEKLNRDLLDFSPPGRIRMKRQYKKREGSHLKY